MLEPGRSGHDVAAAKGVYRWPLTGNDLPLQAFAIPDCLIVIQYRRMMVR